MSGLTLKEKDIKKLENRPLRCRIKCLPKGIKCAYRNILPCDMRKHEKAHEKSILSNRRTKSRYYEVADDTNSDEEQNNEHANTINLEIHPVVNNDVDRSPNHSNSMPPRLQLWNPLKLTSPLHGISPFKSEAATVAADIPGETIVDEEMALHDHDYASNFISSKDHDICLNAVFPSSTPPLQPWTPSIDIEPILSTPGSVISPVFDRLITPSPHSENKNMYETTKIGSDCFSEKHRRKLSFDELSGSKRKSTSMSESQFDTSETVLSLKVEETKLPMNTGISFGVPGSSISNSMTTTSAPSIFGSGAVAQSTTSTQLSSTQFEFQCPFAIKDLIDQNKIYKDTIARLTHENEELKSRLNQLHSQSVNQQDNRQITESDLIENIPSDTVHTGTVKPTAETSNQSSTVQGINNNDDVTQTTISTTSGSCESDFCLSEFLILNIPSKPAAPALSFGLAESSINPTFQLFTPPTFGSNTLDVAGINAAATQLSNIQTSSAPPTYEFGSTTTKPSELPANTGISFGVPSSSVVNSMITTNTSSLSGFGAVTQSTTSSNKSVMSTAVSSATGSNTFAFGSTEIFEAGNTANPTSTAQNAFTIGANKTNTDAIKPLFGVTITHPQSGHGPLSAPKFGDKNDTTPISGGNLSTVTTTSSTNISGNSQTAVVAITTATSTRSIASTLASHGSTSNALVLDSNITSTMTHTFTLSKTSNTIKPVNDERAAPDLVTKIDPTLKATNYLIQQILEQQKQHEEQVNSTSKPRTLIPKKRYLPLRSIPKKRTVRIAEKDPIAETKKSSEPKAKKAKVDEIPDGFGSLNLKKLETHHVPLKIVRVENGKDPSYLLELEQIVDDSATKSKEYYQAYTDLLNLEEAAETLELKQYDQKSLQLSYSKVGKIFKIKKARNTLKMQQAIDEALIDQFELRSTFHKSVILGSIKRDDERFIYIEICDNDFTTVQRLCETKLFDIHFKVNTLPYKIQLKALKLADSFRLHSLIIANPKFNCCQEDRVVDNTKFKFSGKLAQDLNEEQKDVVLSVIRMEESPRTALPYLLFGPAGTGKTRTLVATIEEIVRSSSNCILICANSNSACDEITQRLTKVLKTHEMFRLYAKSYNINKICNDIKPYSNLVRQSGQQSIKYPCLQFIYKFRVLVCTLLTAGNLMRARGDPNFNASHFKYVIIDECASTNEATTLVPIAGICSDEKGINANIVLAGDPKQLDAVCKSSNAAKLGFKISLMERLFNLPLYMRHPVTKNLNPRFITQLVKNYRSHESILHVANRLFYDGTLQCMGPPDIIDWFTDTTFLPNNMPIVFQAVYGCSSKCATDCSLYNMEEIKAVIERIKNLVGSVVKDREVTCTDIGVVTPYKLQCKILSRICRKLNFTDITIGTAEVFQGQEKRIMILSTVRTGGVLGFVNSARRINVVLTRAQSLLIIIGEPETLYTDPHWQYLIHFCYLNNSFIQDKEKTFKPPNPVVEEVPQANIE